MDEKRMSGGSQREPMSAEAEDNGRRDRVLNRECFCVTLDADALEGAIRANAPDAAVAQALIAARPHLFAKAPVFVARSDLTAMLDVVAAIEAAAATRSYQAAVLAWAPAIARQDFGPQGVFMGYDFHLAPAGPRLIEVNTNAGGAFLNAFLARAQTACCREVQEAMQLLTLEDFELAAWRMFLSEWEAQGREGAPRTVAIVDDQPKDQYLYPEFLLAQRFFEHRGLRAIVADPLDLNFSEGRLRHDGQVIDLVYNRLVDFSLEADAHSALREAYLADAIVLTPNPRNHALMADKRNLALLSDREAVAAWGLSETEQRHLLAVPRTRLLKPENAEEFWADRKHLFFKPAGGHGGKAVYRGDKLTRRVWAELQQGAYIAQDLAPPTERRIKVDGAVQSLKLDVRLYTYRGSPLMSAARIYQGQTTNFRTPGGGFAPVFIV